MTSENSNQNPYASALAALRVQRAKIDNTIRVLEELSGLKLSPDAEGELQFVPTSLPDNGGIVETVESPVVLPTGERGQDRIGEAATRLP